MSPAPLSRDIITLLTRSLGGGARNALYLVSTRSIRTTARCIVRDLFTRRSLGHASTRPHLCTRTVLHSAGQRPCYGGYSARPSSSSSSSATTLRAFSFLAFFFTWIVPRRGDGATTKATIEATKEAASCEHRGTGEILARYWRDTGEAPGGRASPWRCRAALSHAERPDKAQSQAGVWPRLGGGQGCCRGGTWAMLLHRRRLGPGLRLHLGLSCRGAAAGLGLVKVILHLMVRVRVRVLGLGPL